MRKYGISIHTTGFDDELRWISNGKQNYNFEQHNYCVRIKYQSLKVQKNTVQEM